MSDTILEVQNLSISFGTKDGTIGAVRDVSFKIAAGETFGLAGESGSGKSIQRLHRGRSDSVQG